MCLPSALSFISSRESRGSLTCVQAPRSIDTCSQLVLQESIALCTVSGTHSESCIKYLTLNGFTGIILAVHTGHILPIFKVRDAPRSPPMILRSSLRPMRLNDSYELVKPSQTAPVQNQRGQFISRQFNKRDGFDVATDQTEGNRSKTYWDHPEVTRAIPDIVA